MAELTVPQIDFAPLGQLPQIWKQGQQDALRQQTLANLGQGGQADAVALLRSGDLSLAQLGINMKNHEDTLRQQAAAEARQAARDKINDQHWQASFGLQQRSANRADEDSFSVQQVTDQAGNTTFVKVNKRTGEVVPTGPAAPTSQINPFSDGGKFNEGQGKAAGFTDRMLQSEGILGQPDIQSQGTSLVQNNLSKVPVAGNYLVSENRQKYEQAKRDFINAQLRRESGAAISPSEFESADKQYFPIPGDSAEVIKQKAQNRRAAVEAMGREGGPSYRPKQIYTSDGRIVALPKVGEMKDGYRFKGGDPANPDSWVKAQ